MRSTDPAPTGQKPTRTLIVSRPDVADRLVAGLGLHERWEKVSRKYGLEPVVVPAGDLAAALEAADAPVVVADGGAVVEELALERLFQPEVAAAEAVTLRHEGLGTAPALCLGSAAAAAMVAHVSSGDGVDVVRLAAAAGTTPGVTVRAEGFDRTYWKTVRDEADARAAHWGLLQQLQWRPGGIVAKYLNRPVSLRISRYLVNGSITPNQVSVFAGVIGAIGVALIFAGGWLNAVIGTGLLQLNSIVDGIDGELARMRHQTSEFGAYLDSVIDEVLNALLMIAVGYHLWQASGWLPYWILGIFAGVMAFAYGAVHWHCKWKHGLGFYWWFEAYKPRVQVQRNTSPFAYLKKLFWKESYLFLYFLAAIFSVMDWMLYLSAAGGLLALVLFFIHIVIKRARW